MISMESSIYNKTPLAAKKQVTGVPTVLYVNEKGQIEEVDEPRNITSMTNTVTTGSNSTPISGSNSAYSVSESNSDSNSDSNLQTNSDSNLQTNSEITSQTNSESKSQITSQITSQINSDSNSQYISESNSSYDVSYSSIPMSDFTPASKDGGPVKPLLPVPATPIPSLQRGGSPWAAFMAAAAPAAPAAVLLGAYSMLPNKRSSGLGAPRRTRKNRRAQKLT
jgi:hypothetical protein